MSGGDFFARAPSSRFSSLAAMGRSLHLASPRRMRFPFRDSATMSHSAGDLGNTMGACTHGIENGTGLDRGRDFLDEQPVRLAVQGTERIQDQLLDPGTLV